MFSLVSSVTGVNKPHSQIRESAGSEERRRLLPKSRSCNHRRAVQKGFFLVGAKIDISVPLGRFFTKKNEEQ